MKKVALWLSLVAAGVSSPAWSALITVSALEDTYISEHAGLGGPNAVHGNDASLFAINAATFRSFPLLRFDLSAFAGEVVQGPATLELFVEGIAAFPQFTRPVSVHQVLIPWSAATATYNNFGAEPVPVPGVQFGADVAAAALDTIFVSYPAPGDRYVSWTLPQALVQSWIDNPLSNQGLLVLNQAANLRDLQFQSIEGLNAPRLSFAVPEPASLALLGIGLAGLGFGRKKRAN